MSEKIQIKIWRASSVPFEWIQRPQGKSRDERRELTASVEYIIDECRRRGDKAIIDFSKKFDKVDLDNKPLYVDKHEIMDAYRKVEEEQISALRSLKEKIEIFERRILERISFVFEAEYVKVSSFPRPIQSVGCYVPGGEAAYPSTLIMTVVPAKVAGVDRIVVCSPPTSDGSINPLTLVAADICEVDEIYKIGGVQAIAALAYGTESIKPVRKIVGPGNKYVTTAKIVVSRDVAIDMPAGPSEIVILADEEAESRIVALDMISQAEHGPDSVSGLITTSPELVDRVINQIENMIPSLSRGRMIAESLSNNGFIIICGTMDEAVRFANEFAPEHLEILTNNPWEVAKQISSAGLVLLGKNTPVSASDYCVGTNHVLPTGGFSHTFSGLSVLDFVKRINFVECSKEALNRLRKDIKSLAKAENLFNHFLAVEGRFNFE